MRTPAALDAIFVKVIAAQWAAFGFIAAEAEVARGTGAPPAR